MNELTLRKLREANIERDSEWNPHNKLTPLFRAVELAGEVGELCNVIKKLERETLGLVGSRANLEQLCDELADVVICVDLIAMHFRVHLGAAIKTKFNKTSKERDLSVRL